MNQVRRCSRQSRIRHGDGRFHRDQPRRQCEASREQTAACFIFLLAQGERFRLSFGIAEGTLLGEGMPSTIVGGL